jgi:hypothetical protein
MIKEFIQRLRDVADLDARAGEPLGRACREAADLIERLQADVERIDYVEKLEGWALVSDDAGHWALVSDGIQSIPDRTPGDVTTLFVIGAEQWRDSVREAIDAVMQE